nr:MAG TPA_asm: hypothetical protein [Caudoviricetes sp.]
MLCTCYTEQRVVETINNKVFTSVLRFFLFTVTRFTSVQFQQAAL